MSLLPPHNGMWWFQVDPNQPTNSREPFLAVCRAFNSGLSCKLSMRRMQEAGRRDPWGRNTKAGRFGRESSHEHREGEPVQGLP